MLQRASLKSLCKSFLERGAPPEGLSLVCWPIATPGILLIRYAGLDVNWAAGLGAPAGRSSEECGCFSSPLYVGLEGRLLLATIPRRCFMVSNFFSCITYFFSEAELIVAWEQIVSFLHVKGGRFGGGRNVGMLRGKKKNNLKTPV